MESIKNQNFLDKYIVEICFIVIIVILCVFIYNLHAETIRLKNRKETITLDCPLPVCPPCPPKTCPSAKQIVNTVFPGRGMDLADGTYSFASVDDFKVNQDNINDGLVDLSKPVNTEDKKYLINKTNLEMDKIKDNLMNVGNNSSDSVDSDSNSKDPLSGDSNNKQPNPSSTPSSTPKSTPTKTLQSFQQDN